MNRAGLLVLIQLMLSVPVGAEEETRYSPGTAAVAGASSQALTSAALDHVTGSGAADTPTQTVLKRAIVGAVTGATATSVSHGPKTNVKAKNVAEDAVSTIEAADEPSRGWSRGRKKGHRPPGWDKGKKTGWGDSDVPPGQTKKR